MWSPPHQPTPGCGPIWRVEEIAVASGWRERLEELAGRRRDAAAVGGLLLAITGIALVGWGGGAPASVAPSSAATATPAAFATGGDAPAPAVHVHVAGAVVAPGLYVLPAGARVADAIDAAGGARRRADLDLLNLAQVLMDGMKIDVRRRGGDPDIGGAPAGAPPSNAPPLVSINSGDQQALETVPGLGPVKAGAIIRYREESGPFTALEQVMEVSGIGPATFEQIQPFISL